MKNKAYFYDQSALPIIFKNTIYSVDNKMAIQYY